MWRKFKRFLCFLAFHSGMLGGLLFLVKITGRNRRVVILFYHSFIEDYAGVLDKGLAGHCDIEVFERQLRYLKRWYTFVSMDDLVDWLNGRKRLKLPAIILTFDDGYRDNYTLAFPLLSRLGIPATIYLVSGLIGTKERVWTDEVQEIVANTQASEFNSPRLLDGESIDLSSREARREANRRVGEALKRVVGWQKDDLIRELRQTLNVRQKERARERKMLCWDEAREMSKAGITFGAHTMTHPILTMINPAAAREEILASKKMAMDALGIRIRHFAIPNGRDADFNDALRRVCKEAGLESIVTTNYGVVSKRSDVYRLRRVPPSWPLDMFACRIARLLLFSGSR